jgi:hypothetical protein
VLNTAARILTRTKTFDHITPVLALLPLKARVDFKVLLFYLQSITRTCSYLSLQFGFAVHTYTYATFTRCRPSAGGRAFLILLEWSADASKRTKQDLKIKVFIEASLYSIVPIIECSLAQG